MLDNRPRQSQMTWQHPVALTLLCKTVYNEKSEAPLATLPEPLAGLIREHRVIDEVVSGARSAIEAAPHQPQNAELVAGAVESLRDLNAFVEVDLAIHIRKEEDVLFPALRGLTADTNVVVEEMLAQHDMVKERQQLLQRSLLKLDAHHDDVRLEREQLSEGLRKANGAPSIEELNNLRDVVRRLHAILQGHFGDEEDDLFEPAATLLAPDVLATLAVATVALDTASRR